MLTELTRVVWPRSGLVRFFHKFCGPRTGLEVQFTDFAELRTRPERTRSKGLVQVQRGLNPELDHILLYYKEKCDRAGHELSERITTGSRSVEL